MIISVYNSPYHLLVNYIIESLMMIHVLTLIYFEKSTKKLCILSLYTSNYIHLVLITVVYYFMYVDLC